MFKGFYNYYRSLSAPDYCFLLYMICYIFMGAFLGEGTQSIQTSIKTGILLMFVLTSYKKSYLQNEIAKKTVIGLVILIVIQFLFQFNIGAFKLLISLVVFYFYSKHSTPQMLSSMVWSIKIGSVILSLSALYLLFKYGLTLNNAYFFRDETLLDKQYFSVFYALTFGFCLMDLLNSKHIWINVFVFVFCLICNLFIVVSKSSFFVFLVLIPIVFLFGDYETKRKYSKLIKWTIVVATAIVLIVPNVDLPLSIKYAVNNTLGVDVFNVSVTALQADRLALTYDIRSDMTDYCLGLFYDNPLFGIGVGRFADVNHASNNYFNYLSETESSWLGILVGGGIFYLCVMLFFFYSNIKWAVASIKKSFSDDSVICLSFFVVYFILFFFNDFMDSLFWIFSGIVCNKLNKIYKGVNI